MSSHSEEMAAQAIWLPLLVLFILIFVVGVFYQPRTELLTTTTSTSSMVAED